MRPSIRCRADRPLLDLVGNGNSDLLAYDSQKYSTLHGWSSNMAPVIMGAPDQPELAQELTNVREIARAHGGAVQVASRDGAGTTFTLVLPCT